MDGEHAGDSIILTGLLPFLLPQQGRVLKVCFNVSPYRQCKAQGIKSQIMVMLMLVSTSDENGLIARS